MQKYRSAAKLRIVLGWLVMTVTLVVTNGGMGYFAYAGELGGFDVDIGADEGILENWEDEPEADPGTAEPEQKAEESSGSYTDAKINPEENVQENNAGTANNYPDDSSLAGGDSSKGSGTGSSTASAPPAKKSPENKKAESNTTVSKENTAPISNPPENNNSTTQGASVKAEKPKDNAAEKSEASSASEKNTFTENQASSQKNADDTKREPAERTKEEHKEEPEEPSPKEPSADRLKYTALGTVFTGVGMAKTSPEFKFYNSNDENKTENEKTEENNNKNVYFDHEENVPLNECPEIKIMGRDDCLDVTILSLRLNGEEVFWHQMEDVLILNQPITEKKNQIELIAVIDGRRVVQMPIWEF